MQGSAVSSQQLHLAETQRILIDLQEKYQPLQVELAQLGQEKNTLLARVAALESELEAKTASENRLMTELADMKEQAEAVYSVSNASAEISKLEVANCQVT